MTTAIWFLVGVAGGLAFVAHARSRGDAERAVLATGLVVAALVYLACAWVHGTWTDVLIEGIGVAVFADFARRGVDRSPMWLAAGWALHPVWDAGMHLAGGGAGYAPAAYAILCIPFDLVVASAVLTRFAPRR